MKKQWWMNVGLVLGMSLVSQAALMHSDSFTGPDLDVQWQSVNGPWALDNGITITDPASGSQWWPYGIKSATGYEVSGNFDLQIDMEPLSNSGNWGYDRFQFVANDGSVMQFEVYHNSSSSSAVYRGKVGSVTGSNYDTSDLTAYSIRLVRVGSTATVYVADYQTTNWVEIATATFSTDSGNVVICQTWPASSGDSIKWSNFQVVPEPVTISLLMMGCIAGLIRRKK